MDYGLLEKLNWYHFIFMGFGGLFILSDYFLENKLFVMPQIEWSFVADTISVFVNVIAIIVAFGIYCVSVQREKQINNELEKLLITELFNNLLCINSNLKKIKDWRETHQDVHGFCYISNDIFYSLIHSNRIVVVKNKFALLISFYHCDQTIRKVMNKSDQISINIMMLSQAFATMLSVSDGSGSLVENTFIEMKKYLKELFKSWNKEAYYLKWQDTTLEEYLQSQDYKEKSENIVENLSPQTY
ncbi:MAG: hypothetical protein NTY81_00800 [Candidatus Staskawiczbacteria bacterium]|nr:hypothetical protein [Candidatus Staskawiczbacteria bacterium]